MKTKLITLITLIALVALFATAKYTSYTNNEYCEEYKVECFYASRLLWEIGDKSLFIGYEDNFRK